MRLEPYLKPEQVLFLRDTSDRDALLTRLAEVAAEAMEGFDAATLAEALRTREAQMATVTPEGVAFPHAMLPGIKSTVVVAARVSPPVSFRNEGSSVQSPEIDLVFAMFGDSGRPWEHVRLLARLARIARGPGALERLRAVEDERQLHETLVKEDRSHG